ncbi:hypothetical protein BN59_00703 [Legionella massiliensis]|uniref:Uncharacterized protein n=1 Tax=Legionella massiliensis TaxID=1034943 RepID=A0A078KXF7_9GAMM|nr:hypothetical protein [Legionella massiliensis]CDZ76434.1 hypothetical protein BN59_00703 [Legionella massiliensis]CEE12172.1 hypothetical protein BN1094_00703 [Legionella massiliensis]
MGCIKNVFLTPLFLCAITFKTFANPEIQFNQMIGTQAIGNLHGCGGLCSLDQAADEILELGSRTIKISISSEMMQPNSKEEKTLNKILNMPFDTYFFWWRSNDYWLNGFNDEAAQQEYDATFNFAKKLLTQFQEKEKTFFLGNWEGDWYLLKMTNGKTTEPTQFQADNMAKWLNIRQKAVSDAREQVASKSKIYLYAEVNQVYEEYKHHDKIRMVNAVLPQTDVDYVSYSTYDVQKENESEISNTLDYIESKLKPSKANIMGRRVFIGEMGMQAKIYNYNKEQHEQANRAILLKFLKWQPPYILYWEIRNNEISGQQQEGFWLIDDKDIKWPLWYSLAGLFKEQDKLVRNTKDSSYQNVWQMTIDYLGQQKL